MNFGETNSMNTEHRKPVLIPVALVMALGLLPVLNGCGGGAQEETIAEAFDIIVSDPDVKAVLVNIFGGILRCDIAARGVVMGAHQSESGLPIVVVMRGTNAEEGLDILRKSDLNVTFADDLSEAAPTVARVIAGGAA